MNDDIVEDKIEQTVTEDPDADAYHVRIEGYLGEIVEQTDGRHTEDYCEQVVLFQRFMMHRMVRLVPRPEDAVHNIFVGEPSYEFPKKKGSDHNEDANENY
jgi:hypothetical protein